MKQVDIATVLLKILDNIRALAANWSNCSKQ